MSNELFDRLKSAAPEFTAGDGARWIKRASEDDAELLAKANAYAVRLGRHLGACLVEHKGQTHIILVGLGGLEYTIAGLAASASTPVLFQLAVRSLDLTPTGTESAIRDALQGQDSLREGYDGHDLEVIEPLFPQMTYVEVVDQEAIFLKDIYRVLGIAICKSGYELPLDLNQETRDVFIDLFENASNHFPMHIALQSLIASFWQTQFIDIYRTIERLFPVLPVSKLSTKICFSSPDSELNNALYEMLGWRPREDGALEGLVRILPRDIIEGYRQSFSIPTDAKDVYAIVSRQIYNTRNSVVHYRGPSDTDTFSSDQWQRIIQLTCRFSVHAYERLATPYFP